MNECLVERMNDLLETEIFAYDEAVPGNVKYELIYFLQRSVQH